MLEGGKLSLDTHGQMRSFSLGEVVGGGSNRFGKTRPDNQSELGFGGRAHSVDGRGSKDDLFFMIWDEEKIAKTLQVKAEVAPIPVSIRKQSDRKKKV